MEASRGRAFLDGVKERRRRHRERSKAVRAVVVVAGFVTLLVGVAMIPLPGPGLLVIAAALAVLALEFVWAERLLERTIDHMGKASDRVKRANPIQRLILALVGALAATATAAAAYLWDIPLVPV